MKPFDRIESEVRSYCRSFPEVFARARAALERYWSDARLESAVETKAETVRAALDALGVEFGGEVRGRGLIQGLALDSDTTAAICREGFDRGLIVETAGADDEVVKILPPLTIQPEIL